MPRSCLGGTTAIRSVFFVDRVLVSYLTTDIITIVCRQMSSMANRTVIVDNNTWNNTHIATVGRALASTEEKAYPILKSLDVDYMLVIFGGMTGYSSDDINKFLWPVRIGSGVYPNDMPKVRAALKVRLPAVHTIV